MATTPGNSVNETTTGITGFTGTAFVGTPVTQYNILTGSSTSSTLNNVAPSATSGVPVISQGASAQPVFGTVAIAGGGTNATSMSTNTGIVKYNGTSLITSTTALIDSSNRMINTAQPCFNIAAALGTDVTGDATLYTINFNSATTNVGSYFDTGTATFTAPVTGQYLFTMTVALSGLLIGHTTYVMQIATDAGTYIVNKLNPFTSAISGTLNLSGSIIVTLNATQTVIGQVRVSGGTKVVDVLASDTFIMGVLLC